MRTIDSSNGGSANPAKTGGQSTLVTGVAGLSTGQFAFDVSAAKVSLTQSVLDLHTDLRELSAAKFVSRDLLRTEFSV